MYPRVVSMIQDSGTVTDTFLGSGVRVTTTLIAP
jgi:hypothetical protein